MEKLMDPYLDCGLHFLIFGPEVPKKFKNNEPRPNKKCGILTFFGRF